MTTRESFVAKFGQPLSIKTIAVPAIGAVCLRGLTGADRETLEAKIVDAREKNQPIARALIVAASVCDPSGKLLFADSDVPHLNTLDWTVLEQIADAAKAANAMRPEDFETAEKNS